MSFTDELRKKILPSTDVFVKAVERDYQDPVKRILRIRKEIRTLSNPKNISRARGDRSHDAMLRLIGKYETLQNKSKESRYKFKQKVENDLDDYSTSRGNDLALLTDDFKNDISGKFIAQLNEGYGQKALTDRLKTYGIISKKGGASKATVHALAYIRSELVKSKTLNEASLQELDKYTAEVVKSIHPQDDRFKNKSSIDASDFASNYYPDLSNESELGRKNRREVISNPEPYYSAEGSAGSFHKQDTVDYEDYSDDIARYKGWLNGQISVRNIPATTTTDEEKTKFVSQMGPFVIENDQVKINEGIPSETKKEAIEILSNNGLKVGSKYTDVVKSSTIQNGLSGMMSQASTEAKISKRVEELKAQEKVISEEAVRTGSLSPTQLTVLYNPLFPRTGFDKSAGYGLQKRVQRLRDEANEPVEVSITEAAPEAPEAAPEAPTEDQVDYPGVGVLPAIQKTLDDAFGDLSEALKSGDEDAGNAARVALGDVLEDFNGLPDNLKGKFRSDVQPYLVSMENLDNKIKELNPESIDAIREKLSIDPEVMEATGTVSDYMVNLGEEENRVPDFNSVSDFLGTYHERFPELYQGAMDHYKRRTGNDMGPSKLGTAVLGDAGNGARILLDETVSIPKSQFDSDDADETLSKFTQLQGLAERAAVSSRIRQQDEAPEAPEEPEEPEEQDKAPGKAPESYASPFDQELIAEFAAEPEDEAPEVEIPELKSAEESMAGERALAKNQQQAYEESVGDRDAIAGVIKGEGRSGQVESEQEISPEDDDDDAALASGMATLKRRPTPTGVPTGTAVEVTDAPTVTGVTEVAPADGAVSSTYAPSPEDRKRDDQAIELNRPPPPGKANVDGKMVDLDTDFDPATAKIPENTALVDNKVVPLEPDPDAQLAKVQADLPVGKTPRIGEDAPPDDQGVIDARSKRAMTGAARDLLTEVSKGSLSYDQAIRASNRIADTFKQFAGPNFNRKLYNEINKRFNKPVEEPEVEPIKSPKISLPSEFNVVTSGTFGPRKDFETGEEKDHEGVDIRAREGTSVFSVKDGVVSKVVRDAGQGGNAGVHVHVDHPDGTQTRYYHGSAVPNTVVEGSRVTSGMEIMKAGSTGRSQAPHLHLEILKNIDGVMTQVNPIEEMPELFSQMTLADGSPVIPEVKIAGSGALQD